MHCYENYYMLFIYHECNNTKSNNMNSLSPRYNNSYSSKNAKSFAGHVGFFFCTIGKHRDTNEKNSVYFSWFRVS